MSKPRLEQIHWDYPKMKKEITHKKNTSYTWEILDIYSWRPKVI